MNTTSQKSLFSTKDIVLIGMFTACMAAISQISIPMPTGVPITIQVFGIALIGSVLGWKHGLCTVCVYILIGAVGLPVFSNFRGGFYILLSYTGGYIWSWPLMAVLCGIPVKSFGKTTNRFLSILLALIGLFIVEILGGAQWAYLSGEKTFHMIMIYALTAFIPKDILLTILGLLVGQEIRSRLF